ncbi:MAG: hypothetical protein HYX75_19380 [Acidobacteria bacterium]|nr:hypothetical protein [Acidobacteriota bacterium]
MKGTTVRELHLRTKHIVERAASGETVTVTKRGVAVAEIRPVGGSPVPVRLPDREKLISKLRKSKTDSGRILEKDRW